MICPTFPPTVVGMSAARLFQLLSLLQRPRAWSATELGERLEVSPRTIRRDVDRLRELGYPVEATMGSAGGYRLVAGGSMPPLLLDDDEAADGTRSERRVEPYGVVSSGRRWYLVAFDVDRDGWRTFRLDRVGGLRSIGGR